MMFVVRRCPGVGLTELCAIERRKRDWRMTVSMSLLVCPCCVVAPALPILGCIKLTYATKAHQ